MHSVHTADPDCAQGALSALRPCARGPCRGPAACRVVGPGGRVAGLLLALHGCVVTYVATQWPCLLPLLVLCIAIQFLQQPCFSCHDTINCIVTPTAKPLLLPRYTWCIATHSPTFISVTIQFGVLRHNPPLANLHYRTPMSRYNITPKT